VLSADEQSFGPMRAAISEAIWRGHRSRPTECGALL